MVQEAYVAGVSTRKVDQVVESLGLRISKSEVSGSAPASTSRSRVPRTGRSEGRYPYLWLDAKVEKVREAGGVVSKALVLAYAVHESGYREVIGLDVGEAETEAFWRELPPRPGRARPHRRAARRLRRARRAEEGDRAGARLPLAALHASTSSARARARAPAQQPMLAALIRPIFTAEDASRRGSSSARRSSG